MSPRRIAIAANEILGMEGTGGAGTADSMLAVALARHGHTVDLLVAPGRDAAELAPAWRRRYEDAGVRIRPLAPEGRMRPDFLGPPMAVLRALREEAPELVIANEWRGLAYAALRARQLGCALRDTAFVLHCHSPARVLAEFARKVPDTVARFGEQVAERASLELADAVVSPSAWLLEWMRSHGWAVPESARVIQYVRQTVALNETPARAPTGQPVRRIAFFGQLREGKGVRVFLAALGKIEPELLAGIELVFLGAASKRWPSDRILRSLPAGVRERSTGVRIETGFDREAALRELCRPGTLAVMPSLLDNSPNTVAECIEHGIPFVASNTGGISELVAEDDRERVLCEPSAEQLAAALTRAISSRPSFAPARPAHEPSESLDAWLELVEKIAPTPPHGAAAATRVAVIAIGDRSGERARRLAEQTRTVGVDVVSAQSRAAGLASASGDWLVFLDDEDAPDDGMLDALVAAQAASGADVVTAAVRSAVTGDVDVFLGDPGALGLVRNHYGVVGLMRRSLLVDRVSLDGSVDPDWPLFARLALGGARIVSIPEPLAGHSGTLGAVGDVPGEGLAVLEAFEEHGGASRELPQLTATLAAAAARAQMSASRSPAASGGIVERSREIVGAEGVAGLTRRAASRVRDRARRQRPPTLPSPLASRILRLRDPRPPLHFLHLGKTGGTAVKHALLDHLTESRYRLLLHGHDVTLADVPVGEKLMFVLRDPISRFVSAFNGRLREDRPRYYYPWREEERVAFARFRTADGLAIALGAEDDTERAEAEQAMHGIGHVNTPYSFWFGDESQFRTRLPDVFFIGFTDQLDDDFDLLARKLGLPSEARLPADAVTAHRSPVDQASELSDVARSNLARWYERDLAFVRLCRELAPQINVVP